MDIKDNKILPAQEVLPTKETKLPVGKDEISKANTILKEYQDKLDPLYRRLIENEKWWQIFNFEVNDIYKDDQMEPSSAWLFNCIISKHADAMDAYPEANLLAREESDKAEAKKLSSIVPVVLQENGFEDTYSAVEWYKLKGGTGCYGVFWDGNKLNGLGDISIKKIDLLNLVWEPGVTDIQHSDNVFHIAMVDNKRLEEAYGDLVRNKLGGNAFSIKTYDSREKKNEAEQSCVVDWYYKKVVNGKTVLHYCKYVNDIVLYATENDMEGSMEDGRLPASETGLYNHGMYPFHFDVLFPVEGKAYGFGYVDVCKQPQKYIDMLNKAIMKNANYGATPRLMAAEAANINEAEYLDPNKPIVHVAGNLDESKVKELPYKPLDSIYVTVLNNKIEELKETSGNRDVSNGGSVSGVTAASAIAAMQEQSGKTSRDSTRASYRTYEKLVTMVIELIRQFYDIPRQFRIIGENGANQYITYDNSNLMVDQGKEMQGAYRLPVFDIEVNAQKANPYTKISQNELILDLYTRGFFSPDNADQALAAIEFMDFTHKDEVRQKIAQNQQLLKTMALMQQQMLQMAEVIDSLKGTNISQVMSQGIMNGAGQAAGFNQQVQSKGSIQTNSLGAVSNENANVTRARQQAQAATQPG